MPEKVNFNEKDIKKYLDTCIIFWRDKRNRAKLRNNKSNKSIFKKIESTEEFKASCYIDAFQSMRVSLFGELF